MANTKQQPVIADIDIEAAINHAMRAHAPFSHDRHRVNINVNDGVVHLSGYVKSAPTYRYALEHIDDVAGVREVIVEDFHNDEEIRLDVGKVVPTGVFVTLEYGAVILSGNLPDGEDVEALVRKVGLVPGVHRVWTNFSS